MEAEVSRHIADIVSEYTTVDTDDVSWFAVPCADESWDTADLISLLGAIALVMKERDDE